MSVTNCKVKFIRPQYSDLREWMEDPNNVYVGRGRIVFLPNEEGVKERFPKEDSLFCNPFVIGKDGDRDEVLEKYRIYLENKLKNKIFMKRFLELKGKTLGCWCHPEKCHANVILEYLEKL